ncbi:MAG: ABC transporter ATP-binding protein [Alphaproteobacteria bacterium]
MSPLLAVSGLGKTFRQGGGLLGGPARDVRAVDGVDFSIAAGETLALVGESGCGKTTIGRMILRLVEPSDGSISFEGEDVRTLRGEALRAFRRKVGIVFQDPHGSLNPRMTIERILEDPLRVNARMGAAERAARVRRLLDEVGLPATAARRYPHEFSGGQRQRIVIARALALRPRLVVCDEPVSALDVSVQAQVLNLLRDLQREHGLGYLFISHDLSVVRLVADRIAVMYLGRIAEVAPAERLFAAPRHPYARALLSAMPVPDPARVRARIVLRGDPPSPADPPPGCRFHTRCPEAIAGCATIAPRLLPAGDDAVACHLANPPTSTQEGPAP